MTTSVTVTVIRAILGQARPGRTSYVHRYTVKHVYCNAFNRAHTRPPTAATPRPSKRTHEMSD